jgi:hypothetical protein
MTAIAAIIVWSLVLGWNPGLALIAIALAVLAIDRYTAGILDRLVQSIESRVPADEE